MTVIIVRRCYYLHHDALGSVRKITNNSGNAENTYRYYPFGSSLSASETVTNDLKFTEKPFVSGIDAYDYSARYYDPEIARFYALDPMPSGGSPYAYCDNNPVLYIDPSGMTTFSQVEIDAGQAGGNGGGGHEINWDAVRSGNWSLSDIWGSNIGSGGYLSNNGVWVSGQTDASGQRFNTWYSSYFNYATRKGYSINDIENVRLNVNRLSNDYFDNIGRWIQEAGIMVNLYKEAPIGGIEKHGSVSPENPTVIKVNTFFSIEEITGTLGHESVHTIQLLSIIGARYNYNEHNYWNYEGPAFNYENDIRRSLGLPILDLEQIKEFYRRYIWGK